MFARRAYLCDLSFGRIPTLKTFYRLIDILDRCRYNEFVLYAPTETGAETEKVALYCKMLGLAFHHLDSRSDNSAFFAEYVLADPCVRRSLAGRVEDMREQLESAEEKGRLEGRKGYLVADWGDECNWQPLVASLPGIVLGGAFASSGRKSAKMDLEKELDAIVGAPLGGTLLRLGTLYLRGGSMKRDSSEFFEILTHDHGYSRPAGLTDLVMREIGGIAGGCRLAAQKFAEENLWAKEIAYMALLMEAAANRRDEPRLRELRAEHGDIWRLRYLEDGRIESMTRIPRF